LILWKNSIVSPSGPVQKAMRTSAGGVDGMVRVLGSIVTLAPARRAASMAVSVSAVLNATCRNPPRRGLLLPAGEDLQATAVARVEHHGPLVVLTPSEHHLEAQALAVEFQAGIKILGLQGHVMKPAPADRLVRAAHGISL